MKAKEYVNRLKSYDDKLEGCYFVILDLVKEVVAIIKARERNSRKGGTSYKSLLSAYREVKQKWASIARQTGFARELFDTVVASSFPSLHNEINKAKLAERQYKRRKQWR